MNLHIFITDTSFGNLVADLVRFHQASASSSQDDIFYLYAFSDGFEFLCDWDSIFVIKSQMVKKGKYDFRYFQDRMKTIIQAKIDISSLIQRELHRVDSVKIYLQTIHKFLPNNVYFGYRKRDKVEFFLLQDGIGNYIVTRPIMPQLSYRLSCKFYAALNLMRYKFYLGDIFGMDQRLVKKVFMAYSRELVNRTMIEQKFGNKFICLEDIYDTYLKTRGQFHGAIVSAPGPKRVLFLGQETYIHIWPREGYLKYLESAFRFLFREGEREIIYLLSPGFRIDGNSAIYRKLKNLSKERGVKLTLIENIYAPIELYIMDLHKKYGISEVCGYKCSALLALSGLYSKRFRIYSLLPENAPGIRMRDLGIEEFRLNMNDVDRSSIDK